MEVRVPNLFKNIGQKAGLEIWRIEDLKLYRLNAEDHGKFYTDDCYVILRTVGMEKFLSNNIHYWFGSKASKRDKIAATIYADLMHKQIEATLQREVENSETEKFISYFPESIHISESQNHRRISETKERIHKEDIIEKKLYKFVSEHNEWVTEEILFDAKSVDEGSSYILDTYSKIYVYTNDDETSKTSAAMVHLTAEQMKNSRTQTTLINIDNNSSSGDKEKFFTEFKQKYIILTNDLVDQKNQEKILEKYIREKVDKHLIKSDTNVKTDEINNENSDDQEILTQELPETNANCCEVGECINLQVTVENKDNDITQQNENNKLDIEKEDIKESENEKPMKTLIDENKSERTQTHVNFQNTPNKNNMNQVNVNINTELKNIEIENYNGNIEEVVNTDIKMNKTTNEQPMKKIKKQVTFDENLRDMAVDDVFEDPNDTNNRKEKHNNFVPIKESLDSEKSQENTGYKKMNLKVVMISAAILFLALAMTYIIQ